MIESVTVDMVCTGDIHWPKSWQIPSLLQITDQGSCAAIACCLAPNARDEEIVIVRSAKPYENATGIDIMGSTIIWTQYFREVSV